MNFRNLTNLSKNSTFSNLLHSALNLIFIVFEGVYCASFDSGVLGGLIPVHMNINVTKFLKFADFLNL